MKTPRYTHLLIKKIQFPDQPVTDCQCSCNESQTSSNPTLNSNLNDVETKLFGKNPHICDSSNGQHKHQCFELIQQIQQIQQKSDEVERVELSDHIQFLITEVNAPAAPSIQEKEPTDDVDVLTEGNWFLLSRSLFQLNKRKLNSQREKVLNLLA